MSLANKLATNTFLYVVAEVLYRGLNLFLILLLARLVSVDQFGVYSFAIAAGLFLSAISDVGLSNFVLREIAVRENRKVDYWKALVPARFVISLVTFILYVLIVLLLPIGEYAMILWLLAAVSLVDSFSVFVTSFYRAVDEAVPIVKSKIGATIGAAVMLVMLWLVLPSIGGLMLIAIVTLASAIVNLGLLLLSSKLRWSKQPFTIDMWTWPRMSLIVGALKVSVVFMIATFSYMVVVRANTLLLTLMNSATEAGLFNAAYTVVSIVLVLASLFSFIFYRTIAQATIKNNQDVFSFIIKYVLILILPIVVALVVSSDSIMLFAFGSAYGIASLSLILLGLSLPFAFLNTMLQIMMVSVNREKSLTGSILAAAVVAVIVSVVLIPSYGNTGAAWSSLISEMVIFVVSIVVLWRAGIKLRFDPRAIKVVLANLILLVVLWSAPLVWYAKLIMLPALYLPLILLLGVATRRDLTLFKEIVFLRPAMARIERSWFYKLFS